MVIATLTQDNPVPSAVVLEVVRRLERGEVLVLPTDTVYGLHALSRNQEAVDRIRAIKGVEADRPFSNLFHSSIGLGRYVVLPEGPMRHRLIESWPGAVTWVLPARPGAPKPVLSQQNTLGVRIPDHPFLRGVIAALDDLIVSTSANRHGARSPHTQELLEQSLLDEADGVLLDERPLPGRPSEVKRWTPTGPEILRVREQGPRSRQKLNILVVCTGNICRSPMAEVVLRSALDEAGIEKALVRSAGTRAREPLHATLPAIEVMRKRGFDLAGHSSRQLDPELMEWADIVLAMTVNHVSEIEDAFPDHADKLYLFNSYPSKGTEDSYGIDDPYGLSEEVYSEIADEIESVVERIVPYLAARQPGSGG